MERRGYRVSVFAREKDVTEKLLQAYGIPYTMIAGQAESLPRLILTQLVYELRLALAANRIKPTVMMGIGGIAATHVATLLGATSIVFTDDDDVLANRLSTPLADVVCTPEHLSADFGEKHIRYPGYHELAYLHPNKFEPDPDVLVEHGIDPDDEFFVVRFVGWNAHHDVGKRGFSPAGKRELVSLLDTHGDVYITSETPLPPEYESYQLPVPPQAVHHLLYYADMYVGDSQTMATEAAILGTPAVRSNSFAGGQADMSNFVKLEQKYELLYSISDQKQAIETVERLLQQTDRDIKWHEKREALLEDTIDVTDYVVDLVDEVA